MQVFLTLCTLVTLYFAKEIPLVEKLADHMSDSAPLLNVKQPASDSLNSNHDMQVGGLSSIISEVGGKTPFKSKMHVDLKDKKDQKEAFADGSGAVLVNFLTSLRHLPPSMHSVLLVMAFSWVRFQYLHSSEIRSLDLSCFVSPRVLIRSVP